MIFHLPLQALSDREIHMVKNVYQRKNEKFQGYIPKLGSSDHFPFLKSKSFPGFEHFG